MGIYEESYLYHQREKTISTILFQMQDSKRSGVFLGYQDEFRVSLKSSLLSQSRIISFDLYQLSQYIFQEMRQGNMRDITIDDVKQILKDRVEQTLKYIHHYHWDTNRFDEEEVQKRIAETQKKERELKDHLKKEVRASRVIDVTTGGQYAVNRIFGADEHAAPAVHDCVPD